MIWSILKIILFVGAVAVLTSLAGYLIEAGGEIRVAVGAIEPQFYKLLLKGLGFTKEEV